MITATIAGTAILAPFLYIEYMAHEAEMVKLGYPAGFALPDSWSELAQCFLTPYMLFQIVACFSMLALGGFFVFNWLSQKFRK